MNKTIGYSHIASSYNELHKEEQLGKLIAFKQKLSFLKSTRLLDLGCGTGLSSAMFDCVKVGLDSSIEMLKVSSFPDLIKVCGEAEKLPFKAKSFDAIICLTAIHNFQDKTAAVKEIKRVCSGIVAISVLKRAKEAGIILKLLRKSFRIKEEINTPQDTVLLGFTK